MPKINTDSLTRCVETLEGVLGGLQGVHVAVSAADEGRRISEDRSRTSSASSPVSTGEAALAASAVWAWASPSARGSWRLTEVGYGPKATGQTWARSSPSPYRRRTARVPWRRRHFQWVPPPARAGRPRARCAYWRWTRPGGTQARPRRNLHCELRAHRTGEVMSEVVEIAKA